MMETIIILIVLLFIFAYYSYFTIYKKTNNIKITLTFFLLYGISIIFYFIYSEEYPLILAYLLPTSLYACIFLNFRKKVNERNICISKLKKSYSYNHFEYSRVSVLIMGTGIFIVLFLIIFKFANYQSIHYIIYFISMGIAVYASTIKYIKIYMFEDKCIIADEKITTINFSEWDSYKIAKNKIIFYSNDDTHKSFKFPRKIIFELEDYFSKANIQKKGS